VHGWVSNAKNQQVMGMMIGNEIQVLIEYAPLVVGLVLMGFSWL
jgi:hypothetical protein